MQKLIIFFISLVFVAAKSPEIQWVRTYWGKDGISGGSVQETSDGGFIIAGTTSKINFGTNVGILSGSYSRIFIIKTDKNGNFLWKKEYDEWIHGGAVFETQGGDFIIFGHKWYHKEIHIISIDSAGDVKWTRTYEWLKKYSISSVRKEEDGGFILLGKIGQFLDKDQDIFLMKIDSLGDTLWIKRFGGEFVDSPSFFQKESDAGYMIIGSKCYDELWSNFDIFLMKIDAKGNLLWTKTYGGEFSELAHAAQQTNDKGYIIAGILHYWGGGKVDEDFYIIKADSLGNILWERRYGGKKYDEPSSVKQTKDGGFIIVGYTKSYGKGKTDAYIIRTDKEGKIIWTKTYGGPNDDKAASVHVTSDGGYIIVGSTGDGRKSKSCVFLMKIKSDYEIQK
ncbi:MAG: hypothetical protein E3J41_00830 [Candidatus Cloacimonadota bacterium]|nr:MAG: hypothetical protein E3J41_00830 [Candidatus Cloacimonadota bacterium]